MRVGNPYDDCTSQSYNYLGNEVSENYDSNNSNEEQQVLFSLQQYVDQIEEIEQTGAAAAQTRPSSPSSEACRKISGRANSSTRRTRH